MLDTSQLPQIARSDTLLVNRAINLRPALASQIASDDTDELVDISIRLTDAWPEGETFHTLEASCSIGSIFLQVSGEAVDALSDLLLPGWREESRAALPDVWRGIYAAERILGLTPIGGQEIDVVPSKASPDQYVSFLNIELAIGGEQYVVWAGLQIAEPAALIRLLPALPTAAPKMRDIAVEAFPFATVRAFPVELIPTLRVGDVMLLDGPSGIVPAQLRLGDGSTWSGILEFEGRFTVELFSGKETAMETLSIENAPENGSRAPAAEGVTLPDQLGNLPVEVEIAFGRTSLRLSQISSVAVGSVLDLQLDLTAPVEILANNERVGRGRLVQIGDAIGVQISQWSDGWQSSV